MSSQADSEKADIEREHRELLADPEHDSLELAAIYIKRGLPKSLAIEVVTALTAHDVPEVHTRDELGITDTSTANPLQAAMASAGSFLAGGLAPLVTALLCRGPTYYGRSQLLQCSLWRCSALRADLRFYRACSG